MAMQFIDLKKQYQLMETEVLARIKTVLDHGQYIMGPEIKELEDKLSAFVGVKHTILNSSGTDALLMALLALDIGPGDEVITTPFSFFATVEVILLCQAKPVFVDIEPITYNINPELLEQAITPRTKAIMPVSLYGQCANFKAINEVAERHQLPVIEDGAQSFGATHHGDFSCGLSTIGCTSFFPSKPLGCYGDGGACFTNDDELAKRLRDIRVHGQAERYVHTRLGINGRMDTLQAAILLEKMAYFPSEIQARQTIAHRYQQGLQSVVKTPEILPHNTSVYAQYTIEVEDRPSFQKALTAQGVPTAIHYPIPMHEQPLMREHGYQKGQFPVSEYLSHRVVSLPMHPYLTEEDQSRVIEAVKHAVTHTQELREEVMA
jgi:UDP-2-acetamido-2-deoxy-ribo-hexuluronate aminotransferase